MSRCWKCWVKGFFLISGVKEPQFIPCISISRLIKKNTLILTTDPNFQRDILVIPTNGLINETQKLAWCELCTFFGWRFVASIPRAFFGRQVVPGFNLLFHSKIHPQEDQPDAKSPKKKPPFGKVFLWFWFGSGEKN